MSWPEYLTAGKALREASSKGMDGILSQEPTVARHALALALHLAQHNAPQLLESQKDLATVVAATCGVYESSGQQRIPSCTLVNPPPALQQDLETAVAATCSTSGAFSEQRNMSITHTNMLTAQGAIATIALTSSSVPHSHQGVQVF